jgi:hypothetical protein
VFMHCRLPVFLVVFSMAFASGVTPLAAQTAKARAKGWTPARTLDGQPDLQGTWVNATITPFERPVQLASKDVLSADEAAQLEQQAAANRVETAPRAGDVGSYNQVWFDSGTKVVKTRQASLVVDPPDGRVPVNSAAEAKRDYNLGHTADSYEYMSTWDRCITRGVPGNMFPAGYNNAYEILQAPGYVVILAEMIHDARVIPLNGGAHVPASIRQWNGDSRGHWEGNTLVVDTTNFERCVRKDQRNSRKRRRPRRGALHAGRSGHDPLRSHHRGSEGVHETMESGDTAQPRSGIHDLRVCLSRRQLRHGGHPQRRPCSGESRTKVGRFRPEFFLLTPGI